MTESMLIFLTIFSIIEGIATWLILQHPEGVELNPINKIFIKYLGITKGLLVSKSIFLTMCIIMGSTGLLLSGIGFWLLCVYLSIYGGILIHNIIVLNKLYPSSDKKKGLV